MLDPAHMPEVAPSEIVARFLMFSKWIRADHTVKHDAFMPPDDLELSVTRHCQATEVELWQVGLQVAAASRRTFHGRADLAVVVFLGQQLQVEADPEPTNPNHARVISWPTEKSKQMLVAKKIAATPGLYCIPPPATGPT